MLQPYIDPPDPLNVYIQYTPLEIAQKILLRMSQQNSNIITYNLLCLFVSVGKLIYLYCCSISNTECEKSSSTSNYTINSFLTKKVSGRYTNYTLYFIYLIPKLLKNSNKHNFILKQESAAVLQYFRMYFSSIILKVNSFQVRYLFCFYNTQYQYNI